MFENKINYIIIFNFALFYEVSNVFTFCRVAALVVVVFLIELITIIGNWCRSCKRTTNISK